MNLKHQMVLGFQIQQIKKQDVVVQEGYESQVNSWMKMIQKVPNQMMRNPLVTMSPKKLWKKCYLF